MCSSLRVIFLLLQTRGVWCVRRGLGRHQELTPSPRPPSQGGHGVPRQLPGLCWSWGGHLWVPDVHRPGLPELQPTAQMAGGCWDPSFPLPQVWAVLLLTGQCAFRPSVVPSGVFSSPSPAPPSVPGEGKGPVKTKPNPNLNPNPNPNTNPNHYTTAFKPNPNSNPNPNPYLSPNPNSNPNPNTDSQSLLFLSLFPGEEKHDPKKQGTRAPDSPAAASACRVLIQGLAGDNEANLTIKRD